MASEPNKKRIENHLTEGALRRRQLIKLGFSGVVLSCLNSGCEKKNSSKPPDSPQAVYELTDGRTLYDDFDGNGCLQTYNNLNLAEAGRLSSAIWIPTDAGGAEVVQNPADRGLISVVNEEGQRVEYRLPEGQSQETKYVFDAAGRLLKVVPHIPGQPYHSSKKFLWLGARDGRYDTENGSLIVKQGEVYGSAEPVLMGGTGWVLKLTNSLPGLLACILTRRRGLEFAEFKTISAAVMVPSNSTGSSFYASLSYHTTIPEQPPGLSWVTDLGIRKYAEREPSLLALSVNRNTDYQVIKDFGQALLDTWYDLRIDLVTRREDPTLKDTEFRIEYYVNGELKGTEMPQDSELLLNPERTGAGPDRWLRLSNSETPEGESVAFFDNVRAVYNNRIK